MNLTNTLLYLIPFTGVLGLLYTFYRSSWVAKQDPGNEKMQKIAGHIAEGAMAFLKAEYKILIWFVVAVAGLLAFTANSELSSP
jgi:K(+)-stimulated pyrophosphate-energized sodium pump